MVTEVVTVTDERNTPAALTPIRPPILYLRPIAAGRTLGERVTYPARNLLPEAEESIRDRILLINVKGREGKIRTIIAEIGGSALPPEIKEVFENWIENFERIDPRETIERSRAIAVLILKVIRPIIIKNAYNPEEQNLWLRHEDFCFEILSAMLPSIEANILKLIIKVILNIGGEEISPEIKLAFDNWVEDFGKIDPKKTEERSLAISILILKVISPGILVSSPEKQKLLLESEDLCFEILKNLLPEGESVEAFIDDCEIGLSDEKLFKEKCKKATLLVNFEKIVLKLFEQMIDSKIDEACALLKKDLLKLLDAREKMTQDIALKIEAAKKRIAQLEEQIKVREERAFEIGVQDAENYSMLKDSFAECEKMMERLLHDYK